MYVAVHISSNQDDVLPQRIVFWQANYNYSARLDHLFADKRPPWAIYLVLDEHDVVESLREVVVRYQFEHAM